MNRRICILSGRYPQTTFSSYANHKAYADRHGYTYISCCWPTGAQNPYFNKLRYIQSYYDLFDYIFWIDDDAFFLDIDKGLDALPVNFDAFLNICKSPDFKKLKTFISSGQFLLKCNKTGRNFIDQLEKIDLKKVSSWWTDDLGYFTNGDQDAMVYLLKTDPSFQQHNILNYRYFNSRIEDLVNRKYIFLLHFTGTVERKMADYKRAQNILGYNPELVPREHENRLGIINPKKNKKPNIINISRIASLFKA